MSGKTKSKIEDEILPLKQNISASVFARTNRGLLLDVFVFFINLFLMRLLAERFIGLVKDASDGDAIASAALFFFCLAIFILPAAGATLKRWHFHHRLQMQGKTADVEKLNFGCLFNPIFYFCLNIVIFSAINAFMMQFIYGKKEPSGTVFISSMFFGMVLTIVQTALIYRYFSLPKREPSSAYLKSPQSETLGDICIFLNMILFQLLWNLITLAFSSGRVSSSGEFVGRIFVLCFLALLIYFPPRLFYLAEDIHCRRVWLTILLANSPVIIRLLYGGL